MLLERDLWERGAFFRSRSSVTVASYSDQLVSVQAAIAAIESGNQSYTVLGRTFTKGDLKTLYDRETMLRSRINKAAAGGIRTQRVIPL